MIRKFFIMQLKAGAEAEYQQRHSPIWKELEDVLRTHGVHNYSIAVQPESGQLFAYAEIQDEARWAAIAETPACRRWWDYMADLMEANADHSPRVVQLREVFHLD